MTDTRVGFDQAYSYDAAGNRTLVTSTVPPSFSISDVTVTEGGSAVFTVTKTGTASQSHSVSFATANGTAVSGTPPAGDYTTQSNTLTFLTSDVTKTITVATTDDTTGESAENFFVNLSSPTGGATISDSQGVGTINDNDGPSFSVNDVTVTEGTSATFTITKTGTATTSLTVSYATANGTATAGTGNDYFSASGSTTFTAAQTTKTVLVVVLNGTVPEPTEHFFLNLTGVTGGTASISDPQGVGTILDND